MRPYASSLTLVALALIALTLSSRSATAQENTRTVASAYASGVSLDYRVNTAPFGGMYTANYHLRNANSYPVEVTFTATFTLQDGTTETKRKGPIRVRANGSVRTGWTGEGDIWERAEGGYPVSVDLSDWSVARAD